MKNCAITPISAPRSSCAAALPRAEARARAVREFGDIHEATDYCTTIDRNAERRRSTRGWWAEVWQDAAHAVRVFRRSPAFAAATVVTLALAIGASTAVYGVLDRYLIRPLPFPESNRLMSIGFAPTVGNTRRGPDLSAVDWTRVDSLFEATAAWDLDGYTISGEPYAESATGAWVTPGYFVSLGLQPAVGRGSEAKSIGPRRRLRSSATRCGFGASIPIPQCSGESSPSTRPIGRRLRRASRSSVYSRAVCGRSNGA